MVTYLNNYVDFDDLYIRRSENEFGLNFQGMSNQRFFPPNSKILQIKQKKVLYKVHNGNVQPHDNVM